MRTELRSGATNNKRTVASGVYKFANIYQAHLSGTTWIFNAATQVKSPEGFDMYIQSPIYSGNHLYYIGAGHNSAIGNGLELEVWNLYYENACAPALQRVGTNQDEVSNTEVVIYPNPFNTEFSIDLSVYAQDENSTSVSVEVIDAAGKNVYKKNVLSELTSISTADWASGMYIIRIIHNGATVNKKVIKY
ncbi:T9SS type A sorting domain-containing protein [Cytophaga aurantiaca]|uniref:T9SS type A sorting domain-containing protein n=1 Tax=Cytophaga aurantiaca TaxID=29530 RepID=UPI00036E7AE5|nr:T9SS type A sorting domain-containing protein [Cytophaga aurantiaca]